MVSKDISRGSEQGLTFHPADSGAAFVCIARPAWAPALAQAVLQIPEQVSQISWPYYSSSCNPLLSTYVGAALFFFLQIQVNLCCQ